MFVEFLSGLEHPAEVAELFGEYTDMLVAGDPVFASYLALQSFDEELRHLEGKYAPPEGCLYLLRVDGGNAGCGGMKRLDESRCELKRMYIRPAFRRMGLGRKLAQRIIADAREAGFHAGSKHVAAPRPHAEGAQPVVSLEDVSFAYPGGTASVDHLDMRVYPGEVVGIVGQNGAGKTTLTKLLHGLPRPASGTVRMAGLDTHEVPTSAIAAHCATLFQNPDYQLCKDTVLEEVAFGLTLQGVDEKDARERASAVIEHFGLPADEAPFSLSRGQRQMVALASVVVMEPEVVLLDEPTSGLDYRECMTVMDTVSKMAERGCAVIMVCHDMEVVSDFAERIVVMANGRILDRGGTLEMFSNAKLMQEASVRAPQVIELSEVLARDLSPEFAGISQVSGIVDLTEEMVRRG